MDRVSRRWINLLEVKYYNGIEEDGLFRTFHKNGELCQRLHT